MPTETTVRANGIDHHVIEWFPSKEETAAPTVLLCHGFLDTSWSYNWVGEVLAEKGYRAVAFDWRGHGDSSWIGDGGYYHFPDYVRDLHELLPKLSPGQQKGGAGPVHLVGHSMGGTACTLFAGTMPEAVKTLTLIEGIGPLSHQLKHTPDRFGAFLRATGRFKSEDRLAIATAQPMPDLQNVLKRLRTQNPNLDEEQGLWIAERATREVPGGYIWKFDPLHRTTSPFPFQTDMLAAFLDRLTMPVLFIGSDDGFHPPDEAERLERVQNLRKRDFEGKGHNLHWFAPTEVAKEIDALVNSASSGG